MNLKHRLIYSIYELLIYAKSCHINIRIFSYIFLLMPSKRLQKNCLFYVIKYYYCILTFVRNENESLVFLIN